MSPREALEHDLKFLGDDAHLLNRFVPIMTQADVTEIRLIAIVLMEIAERASRSVAA